MRTHVKYCDTTGKVCYSSEAKAIRAVHKYETIRRAYYCEDCDNWHITKIGVGLAIKEGIISAEKKQKITANKIESRIEELKRKLENGS